MERDLPSLFVALVGVWSLEYIFLFSFFLDGEFFILLFPSLFRVFG